MTKEEKLDKEIASGIFQEVKLTMRRIERSHRKSPAELKSDAYAQMVRAGCWDDRKIISMYLLIQKKECKASANIRQMVVSIFRAASTNFWAKRIHKKEREKASQELTNKTQLT